MARNRRQGTAGDWLSDRALRGLIAGLRALPYPVRVAAMGRIMSQALGPLAGYRARALANLALVRPDWPEARRAEVARAALDNFGRTVIENYSAADLSRHLARTEPEGEGLPALAEAKAAGRPVLLVTGHFGNYEAPRHVLRREGYLIGGLYRPMRNPFFERHYARTMAAVSGPVFAQGPQGTTGFVRHLRRGGMAVMLIDVHDTQGIWIDFLGRPARTAPSAALIARRLDALVLPFFGIRRADGLGFDVVVEAPVPHAAPEAMTQSMTDRLAAQVRRFPGQWFWVHRRWKGAPEAARPPAGRADPADPADPVGPAPG